MAMTRIIQSLEHLGRAFDRPPRDVIGNMRLFSIVSSPLSYRLRQRLKAEARVRELREEEARILAAFPELRRRPRGSASLSADLRRLGSHGGRRPESMAANKARVNDVSWFSLPGARRPM